jgi:uncharacterized protein YpmB
MKIKHILAILLIVISIIFTACSSTTSQTTSPLKEQPTEPQQVTTESPEPQEATLPYSWTDNDIKITIHGIFKADQDTKEGWIGEDKEQYKVLISYENLSKQTIKEDATVGRLKLMTSNGNLYDPKYIGGESCNFQLDPQEGYQTHNYAFNINESEKPVELWKYESPDEKQPNVVFSVNDLILPPTMKMLELGQSLSIDEFEFRPLSVSDAKLIITGQYAGGVYYVSEPKTGYRFVYLEVEVVNKGKERKQPPLLGGDGEFKLVTQTGNTYQDIASIASLGFGSERWVGEASKEDKEKYPILVNYTFELQPNEQAELVKAFEIPEDSKPAYLTFRLLGDIKTVQINLK